MDASNITIAALGVTIVGLVFKERIKSFSNSIKEKIFPRNYNPIPDLCEHVLEHTKLNRSELNHIKGQLQEVLQRQKVGQDPDLSKISGDVEALFERLNMVAKQVSEVQGSAEYIEAAVKSESERPTAKLYSEGLASLANASSATLERLAAVEKLLVDIVNVLTRRAD